MSRKIIFLFALAIAILILACNGTPTDNDPEEGKLVVLSEPEGAFVFLDGTSTSQTTPAEFDLDPKAYMVKVAKIGWIATPESIRVNLLADETDTAFFELTPASDTAFIAVSANFDFVPIYINSVPTGELTPAMIPVPSGNFEVSVAGWVFDGNYSQTVSLTAGETTAVEFELEFGNRVLIEEFTHVNCPNCPEAAEAVHQVVDNFGGSVVAVEWHPQQSGGTDPFHQANPAIHDGRVSYYGFAGIPRVFVAGKQVPDPRSVSAITAYVNNYMSPDNDAQKVKIWGVAQNGGDLKIGIFAEGISVEGAFNIAVVEKSRHYATAPGTNGMKDFYNVPMEFYSYPSAGTLALSSGVPQYIELSGMNIPTGGNPSDYSYIIWFQRDDDDTYLPEEEILCSPGILEF
ncbi:MAG TPA: PEGA domain-containing protein [candidate division Zixibacteria bacterium]|nr:PEGA domain-containing protein [candidate division Zixibacteria bacterium]